MDALVFCQFFERFNRDATTCPGLSVTFTHKDDDVPFCESLYVTVQAVTEHKVSAVRSHCHNQLYRARDATATLVIVVLPFAIGECVDEVDVFHNACSGVATYRVGADVAPGATFRVMDVKEAPAFLALLLLKVMQDGGASTVSAATELADEFLAQRLAAHTRVAVRVEEKVQLRLEEHERVLGAASATMIVDDVDAAAPKEPHISGLDESDIKDLTSVLQYHQVHITQSHI